MNTTTLRPISQSLRQLLAESFTAEELRHIAATFDARDRVPEALALALAEELADIISTPPMVDSETNRLIFNSPTYGWFSRRAQRIAAARSS
jgi:hypothetical protein